MRALIKPSVMTCLVALYLWSAPGCIAQSREEVSSKITECCGYASGQIFGKLVTLEASPQMWAYISNPADIATGLTPISQFASGLEEFAAKMGWGDLRQTIKNSPVHENENPLVGQMIDSWRDKMSVKLVCNFKPANEALEQTTVSNLSLCVVPITDAGFKPASGKMFMTITASPTATKYSASVAPDGTHFSVIVPAYQNFSQEGLTTALAKCGSTKAH